jgi:hypothetical protein
MNRDKAPLYRKENKVSLSNKYNVVKGGDFRHQRNTKAFLNNDSSHAPMRSGRFGYDYTPLFKFLLSKVGENWDDVFSEAVSRLNEPNPIFWIVAEHEKDKEEIVRCGDCSYYSGLYIDENRILQIVNPDAKFPDVNTLGFETLSFNGKALQKA